MGKHRPAIYFMYKKDLAHWYNVSSKTLRSWIIGLPALYDQLVHYGYEPGDKVFTPRQIETIFSYLGYPERFDHIREKERQYFPVRIYSKSELLELYRTTINTFNRYLSRNADLEEIRRFYTGRRYINAEDVKTIFEWIGWPWGKEI